MRIGVISDTHGRLRPDVFTHFAGVDLIVHAGDVGPPGILDDLGAIAPVLAVWGNTDDFTIRHLVPEVVDQEVAGLRLVVEHGHQHGSPDPALLTRAYPGADVIVYGHTHRPLIERRADALVINPGSAGAARFGLAPSVVLLKVMPDGAPEATLIELNA
jgi:uncharacterized protein